MSGEAFNYETFLRSAFGYKQSCFLDRYGDPAGIATTDGFSDEHIATVKAGTGYAMEILSNSVINDRGGEIDDDELDRLESFTKKVIDASSLADISAAITEFKESVIGRYFDIHVGSGKMTLKKH
ncbi:MAG TPA: hypothetical protein PK933_05665 [Smithellaceae bacterium]|jgi:hypothetical protein|nr:hypothetical protein [Smithellaceae bacterium]